MDGARLRDCARVQASVEAGAGTEGVQHGGLLRKALRGNHGLGSGVLAPGE